MALPDGHAPPKAIYGLPAFFDGRRLLPVTLLDGPTEMVAIYSSVDDGTTWDMVTVVDAEGPLPDELIAAGVAFASNNTWWVAASGEAGAVTTVTVDGGETWQTHGEGPSGSVLEVQAFDDQTAWLTTTDGLFATFDGGNTWNRPQSALG